MHPITDSNEVKYSLADGEQDSGMVEYNHAVKPPCYPAKCANQNLVSLINTGGQQIALLGTW